jgi:hypothetical protein
MLLMALSNKTGALVLTTGNKSEMAVGYCTLYGDMAGGFAVIKDIAKTLGLPPRRAGATRAPYGDPRTDHQPPAVGRVETRIRPIRTACPPYEILDAIVEAYMEKDLSPRAIIARGSCRGRCAGASFICSGSANTRGVRRPIGIRVTQRGFGKDWRYPITNRYRDLY